MRIVWAVACMGTSPDAMERLQIADADRFADERIRWERLYEQDQHAQVFLSWAWLRSFLPIAAGGWRIIVLHEGGDFVAALPLAIRAVPSRYVPLARELTFASDPLGDYQGMLCVPGREAEVLRELTAESAAALGPGVVSRGGGRPRVRDASRRRGDGDDRGRPAALAQIALPATWDEYLASVGASTRRNVRRTFAHLHGELPALRVTRATAADLGAHVDALVGLNHLRWGGNLARARTRYGTLFSNAFANGCLHLVAIWDGAAPIGATAFFLDAQRKRQRVS